MFRSRRKDGDFGQEKVVLVIGSCGLDRLLTVPSYPAADSKVRTTRYDEYGGGNAANTAAAMALLTGANVCSKEARTKIQLLTKIGDDFIGRQLVTELEQSGVDLSSPLFKVGETGSTTGITNIIVSESEHTRTCFHTPGTCGNLTATDIRDVNLDEVFCDVVHVHTDSRHTDASLVLAKEAKQRGITVSIDVEKDRNSKALDELLALADIVCTNSNQIETYLYRLTREFEEEVGLERLREANVVALGSSSLTDLDMELYSQIIKPNSYFTRRYGREGKLTVITKGSQGACSVLSTNITESNVTDEQAPTSNQIEISKDAGKAAVRVNETVVEQFRLAAKLKMRSATYNIHTTGILTDVKVVDTTGAGDAFNGGFILASIIGLKQEASLRFASWVGGRKVQGVGARSALPTAEEVDEALGKTIEEVEASLRQQLSAFRTRPILDASMPLVESWESFERS